MRRIIFCVLALVLGRLALMASPALPGVWQVRQADGTVLSIEQYGDEHHHWTQTTDGVLVVNTGHGYYVADIAADGRLSASALLAHEAGQRPLAEQQAVSRQLARHALFHERGERQATQARRAAAINENGGYFPHTGNPRVLAILVNYQDRAFIIEQPNKAIDQYLNGDEQLNLGNYNQLNYSSVASYFETSSNGQFRPQFDVVGPVTLPHELAYYGGTSSNANDEKMGELSKDAIDLVKDDVDLTLYDNDGDGVVELVYVIFAGYGQNAGGDVSAMWAKMSTQNYKVSDALTVRRVGCNSELFNPAQGYESFINGIGVFCHEFSHSLGLPDLYPTNNAGRMVNNQTMEYWDVMDMGLYTYNGFAPKTYTAWEQEAMGWKTMEELTDTQEGLTLKPVTEADGKAYKIVNPADEREFIVLENMQQSGANYKMYGHGLLAYHVAYPYETVNMGDSPNNTAGQPSVAVIPADGLVISTYQRDTYQSSYGGTYTSAEYRASMAGDPFPGTSGVTQLTFQEPLPNYQFYTLPAVPEGMDDQGLGRSVLNIVEDVEAGTVSFDYVNVYTVEQEPEPDPDPEPTAVRSIVNGQWPMVNGYYDLQGRHHSGKPTQKGVYIVDGKRIAL